jgi:hypothetical protein
VISSTVTELHQSGETPTELRQGAAPVEWWADLVEGGVAAEPLVVPYMAKARQLRFWSGNTPARLVVGGSVESVMLVHAPDRQAFSVEAAERRLEQLEAAAAMPTLFAGDDPDDEPQMPLSSAAVHSAKQILQGVATWAAFMPIHQISIFPMPNGGLQLQRIGPNSLKSHLNLTNRYMRNSPLMTSTGVSTSTG